MTTRVVYTYSLDYLMDEWGAGRFPGLEVTLHGPKGSVRTLAQIDTGAAFCYFDGERASDLGFDLFAGSRIQLVSAMGRDTSARLHEVQLEFLGYRLRAVVAFSTEPVRREILGRQGFLEHVQLGVRERQLTVLIEPSP